MLTADSYCDHDWFEKEKTLLFQRLWQFFTFASLLDKPNKFVAKNLFDIPIVVQNCAGQLRAFENICLHRQAPIQVEGSGCRPLTCPYHGWHYDAEGKLTAIPHEKDLYRFPPDTITGMRLRPFAVAQIGTLIFVNLAEKPIPIEQQFAPAYLEALKNLSMHFDREMIATVWHHRFNWKLMFENLRDGLHASFLHRQTLYQDVKFMPKPMPQPIVETYLKDELGKPTDDPFAELRSFFNWGGRDTPLGCALPPWHEDVERYGREDYYYNWMPFPNLHIASATGGCSFTVAHYIPRGPDATDVEIHIMTARRKKPADDAQACLYEHLAGTKRVLTEDFAMLESLQQGLHKDAPLPNWGTYELRNHRVASWIARVVNGKIAF
jgi:phenylpropionate dioxygenase-like ring-hydroxylating dioxygenase large terminal subunit